MSEDLKAAYKRIDALTANHFKNLLRSTWEQHQRLLRPPRELLTLLMLQFPHIMRIFRVVKNNVSPRRRIIPITTCHSHFQTLSDTGDDDDTEEFRVVGHSIVN